MEKYFVSFADSRLHRTLARIHAEAEALGVFDDIYCLNERDLDREFWEAHEEFILTSPRGYGFWIWKPQVVQQILRRIPDGALLLYADAGCQLNIEGMDRLNQYWDLVESSPSGRLVFHLDSGTTEARYTKEWTMIRLGLPSEERQSPQIMAGAFILRKTPDNIQFVSAYSEMCCCYDLLNDEVIIPNNEGFVAHRHDQSIWSCLNKMAEARPVALPDETYWEPEWNKTFPIHARRFNF